MSADAVSDIYNIREVDASLLTSGQPSEAQLESVARAGVQVVVNLAPHDGPRRSRTRPTPSRRSAWTTCTFPSRFRRPPRRISRRSSTPWTPTGRGRTLVHCAANKRVTAFLGLYRVIRLGWTPDEAFALMRTVWEPDAVWSRFIAAAWKQNHRRRS